MTRRIILALVLLLCLTSSAWPKFEGEQRIYLDERFKAVLDQMQALGNQIAALNAQVAELKQNQAQLQLAIIRQQHELQDLDDLASSLRIGDEENFSKLKAGIAELRVANDNSVNKLTGQAAAPTEVGAPAHPPAPATAHQVFQGYITAVEGSSVMIDMGSEQGIQQGSHLTVYKATDPKTLVGVIEVTHVIDADNSRARIVTLNSGIHLEFSDVVRLE
jgi:TolA-binding protein